MANNKDKKDQDTKSEKNLKFTLITQMLNLATSGFGLVAALAWNEVIQSFVKEYIKPIFPETFGIISMFIYAILITVLAVFITYQLSQISAKLQTQKNP